MPQPISTNEQVDVVIRLLEGQRMPPEGVIWERSLAWLASPELQRLGDRKRRQLLDVVCRAFAVQEIEITAALGIPAPPPSEALAERSSRESIREETEFAALLPRGGWFEWYANYTKSTESPLSFHIFSSLVVLGCAIGRRAWINMGFYRLYPNYCVVLIGPTGRVKKTSAVNIAKSLIHQCALMPIMADKPTPEALAAALKDNGQQFIYAPEFSVFFNRSKYNEGLTTLVIRLLDCPDEFEIRTLARGVESVSNVALCVLGGSTMSLLTAGSQDMVTSSGFLNRFLLVVENDTAREFDVPEEGSPDLRHKLVESAKRLLSFSGEFTLNPEARSFYRQWYHTRKQLLRTTPDEVTAEVLERSPDHLLRTAMLVHAAQCDSMQICETCMRTAEGLLKYLERRIPQTVGQLSKTSITKDTDFVLEVLKRLGGTSDHSKLLRRCSHRMNVSAFKAHMETLIESGVVRRETKGAAGVYTLVETQT